MHIVLLCGYKGSGKDTFAKHLVSKYKFHHMKISQPLKNTLKTLFGFSEEQIEGKLKDTIDETWNITPRDAMVYIGTDIFQYKIQELLPNIKRNFWISTLCKSIQEKINAQDNQNIVISDLRFMHELSYIRSLQGSNPNISISVIKILRPSLEIFFNKELHESETEHLKFNFDFIIENNDILQDFHKSIDSIV
ncbi:hypothetical protein QKU58_gp104 [Pyramimonas orientalis virus]|uniref:DNMP kinase n=1 Tax=Pyramimonas orientalis virus 01B TaxID=3134525 RepID=A0A7M3UNH2_9VIRU|nr:hypothetical protein QKU58_gp104 [Pyramimonas orientalis virus]QOI90227.1 hypothetical protein HWQ62_00090 [Pyramimonas orientalis virus]